MMRKQRDARAITSAREFPRKDQIARQSKIVRPNDCVFARSFKKFCQGAPNPSPQSCGPFALLSEVTERRLDQNLQRHARQRFRKLLAPVPTRRLSAGEYHSRNCSARSTQNVRDGQLNDAPNSARTQVVMKDE
jgi:hypothetical protein